MVGKFVFCDNYFLLVRDKKMRVVFFIEKERNNLNDIFNEI